MKKRISKIIIILLFVLFVLAQLRVFGTQNIEIPTRTQGIDYLFYNGLMLTRYVFIVILLIINIIVLCKKKIENKNIFTVYMFLAITIACIASCICMMLNLGDNVDYLKGEGSLRTDSKLRFLYNVVFLLVEIVPTAITLRLKVNNKTDSILYKIINFIAVFITTIPIAIIIGAFVVVIFFN